jgi:hypothetical protein
LRPLKDDERLTLAPDITPLPIRSGEVTAQSPERARSGIEDKRYMVGDETLLAERHQRCERIGPDERVLNLKAVLTVMRWLIHCLPLHSLPFRRRQASVIEFTKTNGIKKNQFTWRPFHPTLNH